MSFRLGYNIAIVLMLPALGCMQCKLEKQLESKKERVLVHVLTSTVPPQINIEKLLPDLISVSSNKALHILQAKIQVSVICNAMTVRFLLPRIMTIRSLMLNFF